MEKTATRRLVRGENGKLTVVFVDTKTGKTITNLRGYKILGQGDNLPQEEEHAEEEKTEDEEEVLPKNRGESGEYRGDNNSGKGNLGLKLTEDQRKNLSKVIGGVAGAYFGGPMGAILGAKVAERIIPKMLEEVETVKKEEEIAPTTTSEVVTPSVSTESINPNLSEQVEEADSKSLSRTAIEENPIQPSEAEKAIDSVTTGEPGVDLEDRPRQISQVDYSLGPRRPNVPEGDITAQVRDVVTDMLGPDYSVRAISGQESINPLTGKRDQYGSNRHRTGMALDFDIVDPQGNVVKDSQTLKDVAQLAAARYDANIGYGPEYMGPGRMHFDTVPEEQFTKGQTTQWGSMGKKWADDLTMARDLGVASPAYYDKMTKNAPVGLMTREEALRDPNEATADVAFDRYTPAERDLMARTLAGEIDLSKTDLGTDLGRQEAFGILSTIENRAGKFGGIEQAITADKQYSTWNDPKSAAIANSNYKANKELYDSLVTEMERDKSLNTGYSSYYNPSIADPGWGAKMAGVTDIGPHRFGSLPEYASAAGDFGTNFGRYDMTKGNVQNATTDQVRGTSGLMADATATADLSGYTPDDRDSFDNGGFGGMTSAENADRTSGGFGDSGDSFSDSSDTGTGRSMGDEGGFGGSFSDRGRDTVGSTSTGTGGVSGPGSTGRTGTHGSDGWGDRTSTSTGTGSVSSQDSPSSPGSNTGGPGSPGGTSSPGRASGIGDQDRSSGWM